LLEDAQGMFFTFRCSEILPENPGLDSESLPENAFVCKNPAAPSPMPRLLIFGLVLLELSSYDFAPVQQFMWDQQMSKGCWHF